MSLIKTLNLYHNSTPQIYNIKEELCFACEPYYNPDQFYWNKCDDIMNKRGDEVLQRDWNTIKFLDYKLSKDMYHYNESSNCLHRFIENTQEWKILHVVNSSTSELPMFEMPEWEDLLLKFGMHDLQKITIEIVNKRISRATQPHSHVYGEGGEYSVKHYEEGLKRCERIDSQWIHYFMYVSPKEYIYDGRKYIDIGRVLT